MRIRKPLAAVAISVATVTAAGVAFAAWNADGSGTATVAGKTASRLQVSNAAITDALFPGGTSNLSVKVKNPNPYPVTVTSITNDTSAAITVATLAGATCAASNVSFTNQTVNVPIAVNAEVTITVPGVKMIGNAEDGCQGATFSFPVVAAGASSASNPA
jgi:hypothetical protein